MIALELLDSEGAGSTIVIRSCLPGDTA